MCNASCLSSTVQHGSQAQSISSYQEQKLSLCPVALSPGAAESLAAQSSTDDTTHQHHTKITHNAFPNYFYCLTCNVSLTIYRAQ